MTETPRFNSQPNQFFFLILGLLKYFEVEGSLQHFEEQLIFLNLVSTNLSISKGWTKKCQKKNLFCF
jgi:hypothetical protein